MRLSRRAVIVPVVLAVLVLSEAACRRGPAAATGRSALASAVATNLPFQARLSGGFRPSTQGPTRAAGDAAPELSPDTRIAIALIEKRAIESPTPEALADLGVGYLIQGDIDRAIATLDDAASQLSTPGPWSDLSAAYLAKAERAPQRRIEYLARALEAAERSLKIERTNDALFNRALARDALAPYTGAPAPWSEYASVEGDAAWRDAAAQEANNDRPIDDVRVRWDARRKDLAARLNANDAEFVRDTVRLYPEASIEFLEHELLVDEKALAAATLLSSAIYEFTRDPMTRDEVAALARNPSTLARAHAEYSQGLKQYQARDLPNAQRSFSRSLQGFTRAQAPYRFWAEQQLALFDWHDGRFDEVHRRLTQVEREARARGFHALLGRALWQKGHALNRQWSLTDGLAAFRESASWYESASQREDAVSVYAALADALRMLGEPSESWVFIGRTLEELTRLRGPVRRYMLLYNAALFAGRDELSETALLFQDAAVREAATASSDFLTEAMIQRSLANFRRGNTALAREDFNDAVRRVTSTPQGAFKSYVSAELEIARTQIEDQGGSSGLQGAIEYFSRTEPGRVPGLYLRLARISRSRATTESALRLGIGALEAQQAGLGDEALQISFFDESWILFQEMISLQLTAKDASRAFEYAERSRARSLLAAAQGSASSRIRLLPDIQSLLPPSVVLVHYSTLADRVLIWTITSSGAASVERSVSERELARLVEQHRTSIRERRERPVSNDRLFELLIEPVKSALSPTSVVVLVPDGQLQQLPFATLRDPATHRYLVEDHTLMVTPSATFFVDARAAAAAKGGGPLNSALLIGNPAADGARSLPGAAAEVVAAAKLYPRHEVLVGRTANKKRFLDRAPAFDVVHFGGHAIANPEFPLLSRLVFADDASGEPSLFAREIARVRFPRTRVVVLAACGTAAGTVSRGEGVMSVARPFLGGGVPLVVASQWDVDDRATEQLTLAFHRELVKSRDPIQALRAAQLSMLRSGDVAQASPESWGAFVAVGTAAP